MSIVEYLCKVSRARKKKAELFSETRLPQGGQNFHQRKRGQKRINTRMVGGFHPWFPPYNQPLGTGKQVVLRGHRSLNQITVFSGALSSGSPRIIKALALSVVILVDYQILFIQNFFCLLIYFFLTY